MSDQIWHCNFCGHEGAFGDKGKCQGCGNDLLMYGSVISEKSPEPKKRWGIVILAAVISLLVAAAVAATVFFLLNREQNDGDPIVVTLRPYAEALVDDPDAFKADENNLNLTAEGYCDGIIFKFSIFDNFEYDENDPNGNLGNEGAHNLFDGDVETKWCVEAPPSEYNNAIVFKMTQVVNVTGYSITSGNDNELYHDRNPIVWRLYGTNELPSARMDDVGEDGMTYFESRTVPEGWTLLDYVDAQDPELRDMEASSLMPDLNYYESVFRLVAEGQYRYFMFLIDTNEADCIQISEFTLYGTPNSGESSTPSAELSYPAEDVYKLPGGKVGDTALEGYDVWGAWSTDDGKLVSDAEHSMFVVTNDRMSAGKLSATFTSNGDSGENDNGIVFGMEDNYSLDDCWFWEDPINYPRAPRYYFLFISDAGTLYLAKVACNGQAWTELVQSQIIIGYSHGGTVTISAEFDGKGNIKCYANDELLIEYQDTNGPTGSRYGIRAEVEGVVYDSLIAEHSEE